MVLQKKNTFIKKIKDISLGGTLSLTLLGAMTVLPSCESGPTQYETVHTKGVATYIRQTEEGDFKITDEKIVEPENSKAYVTYLDGHTEILAMEEVKKLIAADTTKQITQEWSSGNEEQKTTQTNNNQGYHSSGLGTLLWYSAIGNMMGRSMAPQPGFYANQAAYQKSQQVTSTYRNSTIQRPVGGRKGFFSRSGSSGSRSFGG